MNLGRLILREIWYRKLNFTLGVLSVLVAVGCLVVQLLLLDQHDRQTDLILKEEREKTERAWPSSKTTIARSAWGWASTC